MYVAKTSKDDATGTEEDPFATIERARDTLTGRTSERRPGVVRNRVVNSRLHDLGGGVFTAGGDRDSL